MLEYFRASPNRENSPTVCFVAFSRRKPVPILLENALGFEGSGIIEALGDCSDPELELPIGQRVVSTAVGFQARVAEQK